MTPRISELRAMLHRYNHQYYVENAPSISDQEFDKLMAELITLEQNHPECYDPNSPSQRVGSDLSIDFTQVTHEHPMLSLANTYNRKEVGDFYDRVMQGLEGEPFEVCAELKFDGLSISLIYEEGRLVRALTRGDGLQGDDVTANVRPIRAIPLVLTAGEKWPARFEIRGEILMPWKSFDRLNAEREAREENLFANPRNAASGTLKSKDSRVVAQRQLDAYFYYLILDESEGEDYKSHYDNMQKAKKWGFKVSEAMKLCRSQKEVSDYLEYWDEERKSLPVATDGVVLKVNNLVQQSRLGYTAKSPRWAIAYKFQAERACTRLNEVTFQVGRTGAITPVANMTPVLLAGTMVKRASLHNEDIINQLDLHIGDQVYVEKAGEIIPQIVGVASELRGKDLGDKVTFITHCPECGTPLIRYDGEAVHYCLNVNCAPQLKGRIEHFISRDAMNIMSLGPEVVDKYFENGLVRTPADLFRLTLHEWDKQWYLTNGEFQAPTLFAPLEDKHVMIPVSQRSTQKILDGIAKAKSVSFDRLLYALGIRFVGKVVAKNIARHFKSMTALRAATLEDIVKVDGVGVVIAQSVLQYFRQPDNLKLIDDLTQIGLQMAMHDTMQTDSALAEKSIVISGTFVRHSREEYKNIIESHGGKNVSSISSRTSFVLAGDSIGPSKREKAEKLGIPLVDEMSFLKMIGEEN